MSKKRLTSLLVFIVAVGLISYVIATNQPAKIGAEEGMIAPDFSLPLWHTGEVVELSSFRGEIVVLNLWASWCPPCRNEMPELNQLYEDYKGKGVKVVGVNLASHERSPEGAAEFMEEFNVQFPTFVDQPNEDNKGIVSTLYNINSIPYTYVIDQDGKISRVHRGAVTYEMLVNYIEEVK
jgi:peroxiredoxin